MRNIPEKPRKKGITLGFTPVLTVVVLAITALTAAYVGGVMSGRHLFLPPAVPAPEEAPAEAPVPPEGILKPGELDFAHVLRGESRPNPAPQPPKVEPKPLKPESPAADVEAPKVFEVSPEPDRMPSDSPAQLHDYVFQLAALKDPVAVDALREQLEGKGLRTRLERNGKLYLILVQLRGTEGRASEIGSIAREMRLGEPLLRSKKPVAQ